MRSTITQDELCGVRGIFFFKKQPYLRHTHTHTHTHTRASYLSKAVISVQGMGQMKNWRRCSKEKKQQRLKGLTWHDLTCTENYRKSDMNLGSITYEVRSDGKYLCREIPGKDQVMQMYIVLKSCILLSHSA